MSRKAALTALLVLLLPALARADVLLPNAPLAGLPQKVWAERWVSWAFPIPPSVNPVLDTTGAQGFRGDVGPVFFLAGTATGNPVTRQVTVPPGKFLFFPLINSFADNTPPITTPPTPPTNFTAQELLDFITPNLSPGVVTLFATIDGVPVPNLTAFRETTDPNAPFSYTVLSADNLVNGFFGFDVSNGTGVYPATEFPTVQDGYYLALTPFAPGTTHVITFGGAFGDGGTQNNTYILQVAPIPEPGTVLLLGIGLIGAAGWRRRRLQPRDVHQPPQRHQTQPRLDQ